MIHPSDYKERIKGAPWLALEKARRYGTTLVVKKDGHIVHLTPDAFEAELLACDNPPVDERPPRR